MGIAMEEELPLTSSTSTSSDLLLVPSKPQLRSEESLSFHADDEESLSKKAQHVEIDLERSETSLGGSDHKPLHNKGGQDGGEDPEKYTEPTNLIEFLVVLRDDILDYLNLLRTNRAFRLFLVSYIFGHMGEWFTYIASISLMEKMLGDDSANSRTSIGVLVMIRLLPTVVLSPFGGVLADAHDRRKSMIILDLIGACTPVFFICATFIDTNKYPSYYGIGMIYFATICQECVCALYEPCRTSMVPLLVQTNDADLKKATTLTGVAWSAVAGFGSALGGFATSYFGARACFCKYTVCRLCLYCSCPTPLARGLKIFFYPHQLSGMDGCCYLISAILMYYVGGNWKVAPDTKYESVWQQIKGMTVDGARYLSTSFFGGLVFFKASAALVTGATNVLNVSLSERDDSGTWLLKELDTEQKLGILFSITGIGCILGPLVADPLTNIGQPRALQLACIWGFVAVTIGCFGIGIFHPFWSVCFFTAVRSAGAGILWLDSQFLLQKFTAKEMLGRVSALDEALATLAEALSSLLCGVLQDRGNLTAERVSGAQAFLGFLFVVAWSMYHCAGRGAACRSNDGELLKSPMKKSS